MFYYMFNALKMYFIIIMVINKFQTNLLNVECECMYLYTSRSSAAITHSSVYKKKLNLLGEFINVKSVINFSNP